MTRYLILATILLIAGLLITFRPKAPNSSELQSNGRNQPMRSTTESAGQLPDLAEPSRTKPRNRIEHPKPTIEETTGLLRNTIIPRVDIQDQPLLEVAAAINGFILEAGIPPHKLRVIIHKSVPSEELRIEELRFVPLEEMRIKELRIRNVPLAELLKYVCDSTRLRYRVEPGIIWFLDITDALSSDILKTEESNSSSESSSASADPFGESPAPQSDPSAADPFAEPEIPSR